MSAFTNSYIYFDNAATTFPKPAKIVAAVVEYMTAIGGNPGRSGHPLSVRADEIVFTARQAISELVSLKNPMHVIFCANATEALNLAILGLARQGDHVITTSMEHNSSIRPLKHLEQAGKITLSIAEFSADGMMNAAALESLVTPATRMMVINHGSNVTGTVQPLKAVGAFCKKHNIILIVDGAQTCGVIPIHMQADGIGLLAFSGHKGLYGPTGTGGLVIADDFDISALQPLKFGGTGSSSDKIEQPDFLPDRYESGTLNVAGLSGLAAGLAFITSEPDGISSICQRKKELAGYFLDRAGREITGFTTYAPPPALQTGVVAFNIQGMSSSKIAYLLAEKYTILCRAGLHCSPLAHKTMGTFPAGAVRFSFGIFNTPGEIDIALEALKVIQHEAA
ncbi:MAG: aminotransferase class V-fold PLP-dependent enzyme [Pseudomonadota bacterium]